MITKPQRKRISNLIYRRENLDTVCPTTMYVGLVTGNISDEGVITGEPIGSGYIRVPINMNATTWSSANDMAASCNLIDISFPEATTSWGSVTYVFLSNVATGGTAYYYMQVNPAKLIQASSTVRFNGDPLGVNGDIILSTNN